MSSVLDSDVAIELVLGKRSRTVSGRPNSEAILDTAAALAQSPNSEQLIAYARELGAERLHPPFSNPDYRVLTARREIFTKWLGNVPGMALNVLDIGGRIQPYRTLLGKLIGRYIAIDVRPAGLTDVAAMGENLPFADYSFDVVLCTQVLCYATQPQRIINEIFRVLRPHGILLLSVPALFPFHAEDDHWRFSGPHLRMLLHRFSDVEVLPEDHAGGIARILATAVDRMTENWNWRIRGSFNGVFMALLHGTGSFLDRLTRHDVRFTTNYSAFARR